MALKYVTSINLNQNELQNPRIHNLAVAPSSPVSGQIYYDTVNNTIFMWDGTVWVSLTSPIISVLGTSPISVSTINKVATISISAATTSAAGSMSSVDKTKLDNSTAVATPNTLVLRDSSGNFATNMITINGIPTNNTDVTTKGYVDGLINGLDWKNSVLVATTGNITLSGTQTIDGIAVGVDKRVLVKDQTTGSQNGIYIVQAGAWSRALDLPAGNSASNATVWVEEGTLNADSIWTCTNNVGADIVNTSALSFTQTNGAGSIIAGNGLTKTGNTIDVVANDASITIASDSIGVHVDNATLEINSTNGVQIKAAGITATHINASALGSGLAGGSGTPISVIGYTPVTGTTVAKKITLTGSIGGGTPTTFTHNLNTRDVCIQILDASTYEPYFADWNPATVNTVTVTAIGTSVAVRVVIIG